MSHEFKELADRMATQPIANGRSSGECCDTLWTIDEDLGKVARANRERTIESVLAIFRG